MAAFEGRQSSTGAFETGGSAARKLAVESFTNIAKTVIGGARASAATADPEVDAIATLLKTAGGPMGVVEVAERLAWNSGRVAEALSRGGSSGRLVFTSSQGSTLVGLPAQPAGAVAAP